MSDAPGLTPAQTAQLAMLLEVASDPKPGNVDRRHDHSDTTFLDFIASSVGALPSLRRAREDGVGVGEVFEDAVRRSQFHSGGNTHFGALLLLVPLVSASYSDAGLGSVSSVVEETTVEDSVRFYDSFSHVDVYVEDDTEIDLPDVNHEGATDEVRERGLTMYDVMEASAEIDDVAREWVTGFGRSFTASGYIDEAYHETRDVNTSVTTAYLRLLSERRDTLVEKKHGREVAEEVRRQAEDILRGGLSAEDLDSALLDEGINPGTTADILSAGVYISLREGGLRL
ncbi:triphosphoribosyl-dephospho-CoA synthase [Halorutilales archaeon Cl-col2-1]